MKTCKHCNRLVPPSREQQGTCCCKCAPRVWPRDQQHTETCRDREAYRQAGYEAGHAAGREVGYDDGFGDGFDEGMEAVRTGEA